MDELISINKVEGAFFDTISVLFAILNKFQIMHKKKTIIFL